MSPIPKPAQLAALGSNPILEDMRPVIHQQTDGMLQDGQILRMDDGLIVFRIADVFSGVARESLIGSFYPDDTHGPVGRDCQAIKKVGGNFGDNAIAVGDIVDFIFFEVAVHRLASITYFRRPF